MLEQGGNAVDAAVAAIFASFITEYTLSAIGGGGFALVYDAQRGDGHLLDFFSAAPGLGRPQPAAPDSIDFQEITVDYGVSHSISTLAAARWPCRATWPGSASWPSSPAGCPCSVLLEPAIRLMRQGCPISEMQAFIGRLIEPILLLTPECAAIFGSPDGGLRQVGDLVRMPELASTLEALAVEGPRLFYHGEVAKAILADQQAHGGLLTAADLHRYRVRRYKPLASSFRRTHVLTNPPPSRGGLLISFALRLLDGFRFETLPNSARPAIWSCCARRCASPAWRAARWKLRICSLVSKSLAYWARPPCGVGPASCVTSCAACVRAGLDAASPARPNTTQISVMDADGLVVSLTTSGGEGTGFIVPGTGVILNNMLGETDLHPQGFHQSTPGKRIPSMMAPTVVLENGQPVLALGSGGANRIRSAIVQVLLNRLAFDLPLTEAVEAPRIHFEDGLLQVEAGNDPQPSPSWRRPAMPSTAGRQRHMYFGGVHAVGAPAGRRPRGRRRRPAWGGGGDP